MEMAITNSLWVEKYRPSILENYIGNEHLKGTISKSVSYTHLTLPTILRV